MDLLPFKLAVVETEKFSDADVEKLFLALEIDVESDIDEAVDALEKYRPALYAKMIERFTT